MFINFSVIVSEKGFFYEFYTPQNLAKNNCGTRSSTPETNGFLFYRKLNRLTVSYSTENCPNYKKL